MRRFFSTYLPASFLFSLLAMTVLTCGGGGGGNRGDLTGLSIGGPSSMPEYGTATYTATASWSNGSTSTVTPTWIVNPQVAEISAGGVLSCQGGVAGDQTVTITATYSSGGITKTATMDVTIIHVQIIPFTEQELSGKVFFEENSYAGGGYDSHLYILHSDFSLEQFSYQSSSGTSARVTGTWSNDPYGLDLSISGQGTVTVQRFSESATEMEMLHYDGPGPPSVVTWEKTVPVDPAKLPGAYTQSPEGYTWVFNANGTGTCSIFGGISLLWSVDSAGVLKMPSSTGYSAWFYARASSQSTASAYTVLKVAFPEFGPGGGFYSYYGGKVLTRQ
jgi:hypothetical protein